MSGYQYVESSNTYELDSETQNLSLADVSGHGPNANIAGNSLNNVLRGDAESNVLDGREGADTLEGGLGNDTYYVDDSDDVVVEAAGEGQDIVISYASYTLSNAVEDLVLQGNDSTNGTGNALGNTIIGNSGNNLLEGRGGDDRLFASDGDDTIDGGEGADRLEGGTGNDTFYVDAAGDVIVEIAGQGEDRVVASISYTLGDNLEHLTLVGTQSLSGLGNSLDNRIAGDGGDDTLEGGTGSDTLAGGAGDDVLSGGDGSDTAVFAGAREHYIITRNDDGSFTVTDTQSGGDGGDVLTGIEFLQFAGSSIDLADVDDPPTGLELDDSTDDVFVVEGEAEVGALTADQSGITWSFDTTAEGGGDAEGMFVIDNGVIKLAPGKALEYDGPGAVHAYTIVVRATNVFGVPATHSFTINVVNDPLEDNRAPTGLVVTGGTVAEDEDVGAIVATLAGEDADAGDTFTYEIVANAEGDMLPGGHALFAIGAGANSDRILLKAGLDDEEVGPHNLWIKATDAGGLSTVRQVTLTVANVNEDPTDVRLDGFSGEVVEGTTIIGALQADDEDGDPISWSFDTTAEGGGDAGDMFVIENGIVKLAPGKMLEYDGLGAIHAYTIHVIASDDHDGETKQTFTINVANDTSDDNRAPTGLTLSIHLYESATSVTVGTLSATDLDGDTLTYALVDGSGNDVSATSDFAIRPVTSGAVVSRYELVTKGGIQVTADETRDIWVKADDGKGGTTIQKFVVTIKDMPAPPNHAPTDIGLSSASVQEGAARGTLIGLLSATDPNAGDSFTYSLTDERFEVSADGRLLVKDGTKIDYETAQVHHIRVTVADRAGATYEKVFAIQVGDAVDTQAGTKRNDALTGGIGSDRLFGSAGNDRLVGAEGNDTLYGGTGKDVLTGNSGQDVFVFDTKANTKTNRDKIADFKVKDDSIWLDNKVFTKLGKKGSEDKPVQLSKSFFTVGSKAKDKNDYVIYDKAKGVLYYDADGSGVGKQVEIATLSKKLAMTYKDFFVI